MRKIIYIPHSVAWTDTTGNIYINRNLKAYDKDLYSRILKHEKQHTMGAYNTQDLKLDYKNNISPWELFKFCLRHPLGFIQHSPLVKVKDILFFSWISLLKLIITICVITAVWLIFK